MVWILGGISYTFSKKQSAIIEILDKEKRPIHKHELMVAAESEQDDPKYIFRLKGKYHPAWNKIIKFDNQGYYWLEYWILKTQEPFYFARYRIFLAKKVFDLIFIIKS